MAERLQKLLAAAGLVSRRGAEAWIRAGRVTVNGRVAGIGDRADPARDRIEVDGRPLPRSRPRYWLLHKPRGVVSTTADPHAGGPGRPTALQLLPVRARRERLYPVGRLDRDSEGLLLLTNDGRAAQALLHPSLGTEKEYRVTVAGALGDAEARRLAAGLVLDDGPTAPCRVSHRRHDRRRDETTLHLTLREGRKRQIRRALASLGHPVRRLLRVRMGPLRLGSLAPGQARPLEPSELRALQAHVRGRERAAPKPSARGGAGKPRGPRARSRGESSDD